MERDLLAYAAWGNRRSEPGRSPDPEVLVKVRDVSGGAEPESPESGEGDGRFEEETAEGERANPDSGETVQISVWGQS